MPAYLHLNFIHKKLNVTSLLAQVQFLAASLIGLNYPLRKTVWEMTGLRWNWVGAVLVLRVM